MPKIFVLDDVLRDPVGYRRAALAQTFGDVAIPGEPVFHGIASADEHLARWISWRFPELATSLSFFRKSPAGQEEPNYIHTDQGMGEWTAILYLNERVPAGDGTSFWKHRQSGCVRSVATDSLKEEWHALYKWERIHHVSARFNRMCIFDSRLFHSRGIAENYGAGNEARLIQVAFGTGPFEQLPLVNSLEDSTVTSCGLAEV